MTSLQFAGIGEILFDVFEDGREMLGGAALNALFHVHQLARATRTGTGVIVSCVGSDTRGEQIHQRLAEAGISDRYVATDPRFPTGIVEVHTADGEATYRIRAGVAWDYIPPSAALDELAAGCDAVCFGTLAQRSETSRQTIRRFVSGAARAIRLCDINLRDSAIAAEKGYSEEIIRSSCELATDIKCNQHELTTVCQILGIDAPADDQESELLRAMERLLQRFNVRSVVVTRGARGLLILTGREVFAETGPPVEADSVHPVGAGDACSAGLLFGFTTGWSLEDTGRLALKMGSWVASQPPATPLLSDSILEYVRSRSCVAAGDKNL